MIAGLLNGWLENTVVSFYTSVASNTMVIVKGDPFTASLTLTALGVIVFIKMLMPSVLEQNARVNFIMNWESWYKFMWMKLGALPSWPVWWPWSKLTECLVFFQALQVGAALIYSKIGAALIYSTNFSCIFSTSSRPNLRFSPRVHTPPEL
jgi:hypothetical protein